MFEKASKLKLRFNTTRGLVTVEDLWDMPLTGNSDFNLDEVAKGIHRKIKESAEESFVVEKSKINNLAELRFEIAKHIINVKLVEKSNNELAINNKAKKEQLLSIIAAKKDNELQDKSIEELTTMVEDL